MNMQELIDHFRSLNFNTLDLEKLYSAALAVDLKALDFEPHVPELPEGGSYGRNILMMEPIEVAVLAWPPGVASAVHHHQGFWGVVGVLRGILNNETFIQEGDLLKEHTAQKGMPGAWLKEEDGVIHLLRNPSKTETALTLHVYYPPLKSFDGMRIFDLDEGRIGVLNASAETASWTEPREGFKEIKENAFTYKPHTEQKAAPSHRLHPVIPKPDKKVIQRLIGEYYAEQAHHYDHFDSAHSSRNKYIQRVNQLIADDLRSRGSVNEYLGIACGTGRRLLRIQELSQADYRLSGVDLSSEMCVLAEERGIHMYNAHWLDAELDGHRFDAISFLYAFGHIAEPEDRLSSLKKMAKHLNRGGRVYLDVFNIDDETEWGPKAVKVYEKNRLDAFGYDRGDVFYKKTGGKATAFLHYFSQDEINALLEEAGLSVLSLKHIGYTHRPGEVLETSNAGAMFIIAEKN